MHFLIHLHRKFPQLRGVDGFIPSAKRLKNGQVGCRIDQLLSCKRPSYGWFFKSAKNGNVYLDFIMAMQGAKPATMVLWRVPQSELADLYQESRLVDLVAP